MDRDKFAWNTTFPSLTVCPHKSKTLIHSQQEMFSDSYPLLCRMFPHKFPTQEEKDDFQYFMDVVSTVSYENLHRLERVRNRTFGITGEDYLDLISNMSSSYKPEVSSGTVAKMYVQETVTEMGICFSTNSKVSVYSDYNYWKRNRWDLIKPNNTVYVHQLDGEIYAQLINLSSAYEVYFHGAMEVADIAKHRYSFGALDYTTVELLGLETLTSANARDLTVSQRQCRYTHESEIMMTTPIYSFNLCTRECRMRLASRICGCFPHFYRSRGRRNEKLGNICDIQGLLCLMTIKGWSLLSCPDESWYFRTFHFTD
ncbi:hypothetical protein HA402_012610 [Bradysia odoriphaga]|nr:hypothetical protein HA402_012610 [Bradysia odoriphaga]